MIFQYFSHDDKLMKYFVIQLRYLCDVHFKSNDNFYLSFISVNYPHQNYRTPPKS